MSESEYLDPDTRDPYSPPLSSGAGRESNIPHNPNRSRSLVKNGIIAAVFLGIFPVVSIIIGAIVWSRAKGDLDKMERGLMSLEDGARGKTKAGLILGKVNTIVGPFALITLIFYYGMLFGNM